MLEGVGGRDQVAYRAGIGQCVTMNNELVEESLEQPCDGLTTTTDQGIFAYAFCQAGTGVAIGKVNMRYMRQHAKTHFPWN
jgi:hypothetical protein